MTNSFKSADEQIESFLLSVDSWVESSGFFEIELDKEKISDILGLDHDEIKEKSGEELLLDSLLLTKYADNLQKSYNHQKMILEFAESSIMHIVSPKLVPIQGDYTKHEVKYSNAIREDIMCSKLIKMASVARARLNEADGRIYNVKKMVDIMQDLAKRKKYEFS
jgi:hypothetical protein